MSIKRIENIYDVTFRLLGQIEPQGESNIDEVRLINLKDAIDLAEQLVNDIILVARHKGRHENSMNEAGITADKFIDYLKDRLDV